MPEVTKVKTTRDYVLFGRVWLEGSIFYVEASRKTNFGLESNIYSSDGKEKLGCIKGTWEAFGKGTLFEKYVDPLPTNNDMMYTLLAEEHKRLLSHE